ncbi:MAG: hypothetical protein JOY93_09750 [Acidobacteriales bacterium]|nr:hypothetical protein [Terriglobales bacterium]
MEPNDEMQGINEQAQARHIPHSVKMCLFFSTVGLVLLEVECVQGLLSKPWTYAQLRHPWAYPCFIFLPWAFCVWGVWRLSGLAARHRLVGSEVIRLMEGLAGMPVWTYLLTWQWNEFVLAISKLK